jgi:hypothetical protein
MIEHETVPSVQFQHAMTESDRPPTWETADTDDAVMGRLRDPFHLSPQASPPGQADVSLEDERRSTASAGGGIASTGVTA